MAGPVKLSRRGQEVAELVALGLSNREIAGRLFLSERTVEWHVEQILNRLGFTSRSQVAAWVGRVQVGIAVRVPGTKRRGSLPAPLTGFVGRERDLEALRDLVTANRLLTQRFFSPANALAHSGRGAEVEDEGFAPRHSR